MQTTLKKQSEKRRSYAELHLRYKSSLKIDLRDITFNPFMQGFLPPVLNSLLFLCFFFISSIVVNCCCTKTVYRKGLS